MANLIRYVHFHRPFVPYCGTNGQVLGVLARIRQFVPRGPAVNTGRPSTRAVDTVIIRRHALFRKALVKPEIGQRVRGTVFESALDNRPSRTAIDDHRNSDDLRPQLAERVDRGQNGRTGRRRVFDSENGSADDIGAFDATLQAVVLLGLAHDKGVEDAITSFRRMEHRGSDRVRTECQPADSDVVPIRGEVAHDLADERCRYSIERDAAQVDVVVGFTTARKDDLAANYCLLDDLFS